MADRAQSGSWETYLVEHYRPGVAVDELERSVASVRDAVVAMQREGKSVQHVSSTIVPGDESSYASSPPSRKSSCTRRTPA
jgi:hypothetical protein